MHLVEHEVAHPFEYGAFLHHVVLEVAQPPECGAFLHQIRASAGFEKKRMRGRRTFPFFRPKPPAVSAPDAGSCRQSFFRRNARIAAE